MSELTPYMTTDRVREIQESTAYPDSQSVMRALMQVWNETDRALRGKQQQPTDSSSYYEICKQYETKNGFVADVRYIHNDHLCGHVVAPECANGFIMMLWARDGIVLGADPSFDLVMNSSNGAE